jgi:hypothetical protein
MMRFDNARTPLRDPRTAGNRPSARRKTLAPSKTRRPASVALLIALALLLTGCMHIDRSVALNADGSGSYTLTIGFSQQVMSAAGSQVNDTMTTFGDQVKLEGGSTRQYQDAGYSYWAYTRPFKSIADLNTMLQQTPQSTGGSNSTGNLTNLIGAAQDTLAFSEQDGLLDNTFHVTGHMSMIPQSGATGAVPLALQDMRESFSVSMPGAITSHKGGVTHGNTVTYVIHYGQATDIDVVGGGADLARLALIGLGAVLVALIIIAALLLWRRGRQRGQRQPTAQPPAQGFAPVYTPAFTPPFNSAAPDAPTVPATPSPDDPSPRPE